MSGPGSRSSGVPKSSDRKACEQEAADLHRHDRNRPSHDAPFRQYAANRALRIDKAKSTTLGLQLVLDLRFSRALLAPVAGLGADLLQDRLQHLERRKDVLARELARARRRACGKGGPDRLVLLVVAQVQPVDRVVAGRPDGGAAEGSPCALRQLLDKR